MEFLLKIKPFIKTGWCGEVCYLKDKLHLHPVDSKFTKMHDVRVIYIFSRVLKIYYWFLVHMKAEIPHFTNQKFFTPLTSFLPPFCLLKTNRVKIVKSGNFDLFRMFICQSGGKKLVSGVKNFRYAKLDYSALICTKNLGKISQIREIGWKSNFDIWMRFFRCVWK